MQEPLTLYKLIVLYMLDRVNFPLTKAQISDFILEREYTNFLTLQTAMAELTEAGFLTSRSAGNRTQLSITKDGRDALRYFENRINDAIKREIDQYLRDNQLELRNELSVTADYYKATTGEYEARLCAREKGVPLADITLSVPDEETAVSICDNWLRKNQDIYQYLVQQLF